MILWGLWSTYSNSGGGNKAGDFPSSASGETRFRDGTLEVGPTWRNGGYAGELFGSGAGFGGGSDGMMSAFIRSKVQATAMLNPDLYFPRLQIVTDLTYLAGVREAMRVDRVLTRTPQVAAPLPPSSGQLNALIDDAFERNLGPIRNAGQIKTDWKAWRDQLGGQTMPQLIEMANKRDFPLSEAYIDALEKEVAETKMLIDERAASRSESGAQVIAQLGDGASWLKTRSNVQGHELRIKSNIRNSPALSSPFQRRQIAIERRIAATTPSTLQGEEAKTLAVAALAQADFAWQGGLEGDAAIYQEIAVALIDIATSLTPFIGSGKAAYEFLTGTSLITGQPISDTERLLAGASFATAGIIGSAAATLKVLGKLGQSSIATSRIATSVIKVGYPQISVLRHSLTKLNARGLVTAVREAEEVNRASIASAARANRVRFVKVSPQPPWNAGSLVVEMTLQEPLTVVRLHVGASRNGRWFALADDVKGLSKTDIQRKFGLPSSPELASSATLPRGTVIRTGEVGPTTFGLDHGTRQVEVPFAKIRDKWFSAKPERL